MKGAMFAVMALIPLALAGADTNSAPTLQRESFQAQVARSARENPPLLKELKPNELKLGKAIASGITVAVVKGAPLQLLNPVAPAAYGPEDNVIRDPVSGKVAGLKVFQLALP